jgi:hypothetical protein
MNNNTIAKICELPLDFKKGDKSSFQLTKESGFDDGNKKSVISAIKDYLELHSSLINDWLMWSQDKRTRGGFYLIVDMHNIVGSIDPKYKRIDKEFETPIDACSEYIYLEISSILNIRIDD